MPATGVPPPTSTAAGVGAPAAYRSGVPRGIPRPSEVRPDPSVVDLAPRRWTRVQPAPDGRSLAVYFVLGKPPCSVLGRVDTEDAADAVTVTLQVGRLPEADCTGAQPMLAGPRVVTVPLSRPLGNRHVLDGAA